jgi:hypothetical protein
VRRDWTIAAFLETEKHFQRIGGYKEPWSLKAYLDEQDETKELATQKKTA